MFAHLQTFRHGRSQKKKKNGGLVDTVAVLHRELAIEHTASVNKTCIIISRIKCTLLSRLACEDLFKIIFYELQ